MKAIVTAAPTLPCQQCGAPVPTENDDPFPTCEHCGASLFLDLNLVLQHAAARPRLDESAVKGALLRHLRSAEVAGDPTQIDIRTVFIPFFLVSTDEGFASVLATTIEHAHLKVSLSGDLVPYSALESNGAAQVVPPQLTLDDAIAKVRSGRAQGTRLVHVPFFRLRYQHSGRPHDAWVDGLEGKVLADTLPPTASKVLDRSYGAIAALAFVLFTASSIFLPGLGWPMLACVGIGAALWLLHDPAGKRKAMR